MKKWFGMGLLIMAVSTVLLVNISAKNSRLSSVKNGTTAPDFSLPDTDGKTHALSDYKGKTVVLEWVNHGCPFVRKHYNSGNMQSLQKEMTKKGLVWLSICSSAKGKQGYMEAGEWNKMIEEKGSAATAVLLDPDGDVGRMYGARTTPHMYLIDPKGTLIYQGAIDSIASTDVDDIPRATNYIRQAVNDLMAGKPVQTAQTEPYGCSVKY